MRDFRRLTMPTRAHPLVKRMFEEMARQQIGVLDLAERAGVNPNTLRDWRTRTMPTIDNLEACLNVLGLGTSVGTTRPAGGGALQGNGTTAAAEAAASGFAPLVAEVVVATDWADLERLGREGRVQGKVGPHW